MMLVISKKFENKLIITCIDRLLFVILLFHYNIDMEYMLNLMKYLNK